MCAVQITESDIELPTGVTLRVRESGPIDGPVLIFLHGFPEGAFAWDGMLERLAVQGYRCLAPYLRGFGPSSNPEGVEAYRVSEVAKDIGALAMMVSPARPLAALVAHDWGGAAGWALGARAPQLMERLIIINSPHPATFLRDVQHDPGQRAASEYMNALAADDAEVRFAEDDYRRLWRVLEGMGPSDSWLDAAARQRYRELWDQGLTGGLNYYRATPVRPLPGLESITLPPALLEVSVPTLVIWGMGDTALLPGLTVGLDEYVSDLKIERVPDATHWIVHEQPDLVEGLITEFLDGHSGE